MSSCDLGGIMALVKVRHWRCGECPASCRSTRRTTYSVEWRVSQKYCLVLGA